MSKHTEGPWHVKPSGVGVIAGCIGITQGGYVGGQSVVSMQQFDAQREANANLIAAAPAMSLALELIAAGLARIEGSEFCFNGLRYSIGGDWNKTMATMMKTSHPTPTESVSGDEVYPESNPRPRGNRK